MKYGNMTREQLEKELSESHQLIDKLKIQVSMLKRSARMKDWIEEKYHLHFSLSNDVMFTYDLSLMVTSVSPNVDRILGYKPEELTGRYFYDLGILHPADLNDAIEDSLRILNGNVIVYTIYRFFTKDGRVKFGEISAIPFKRDGQVVEMISVAREITDRIERQKQIREGEETARALLDASIDASLLLDVSGNVIAINEAAARRFGKAVRELMGVNIFTDTLKETTAWIRPSFDRVVRTAKPVRFNRDVSDRLLHVSLYPVRDMQGIVSRVAMNIKDITVLDSKRFQG